MFGFGKKKENGIPACACNGAVPTYEAETASCGCGGSCGLTLESVKVLGSGCKSCHALFENTREALQSMGAGIEAEYITDMKAVAAYGVMSTPALVVNEQIVSMGRVLSAADTEKLFRKLGY